MPGRPAAWGRQARRDRCSSQLLSSRIAALEQQEAHHTAPLQLAGVSAAAETRCKCAVINCAQGQVYVQSLKGEDAKGGSMVLGAQHAATTCRVSRGAVEPIQGATPQCAAAQQIDVESVSRDAKMHDEGSFHSITTAEGHSGSRSQIAAAVPRGQKAASRSPAIPLQAEAKPTAAPCMRASPPQPLSWHLAPARHEG